MMALVTVSAIFLRWLPSHGFAILLLVVVSSAAALAIFVNRRRGYISASLGIAREHVDPAIAEVLWTTLAVVSLGALGIAVVWISL